MKKSSIIWTIVIVVVVVIAGYFWWASMSSSPSSTVTTTTQPSGTSQTAPTSATNPSGTAPTPSADLTLNNSGGGSFGAYLSAANGMTLYQYTKDSIGVSNCAGICATNWPPYTVTATQAAGLTANPGIAGKISTITRADGSLQVTYRGLPLYFFVGDKKPGDTTGEAVNGFTEVAP